MNSPRFLTLTLASSTRPLAEQVTRLYTAFKELRRLRCWKEHVTGGVYAFEVTLNGHKGTWHPHLHLVIDGEYFPHKLIKEAWLQVTGDSCIVHIEKVHSAHSQARYLAEYVATPADVVKWNDDQICEYAEALHGRRLLHTFGSLHNRPVDPPDEEETPGTFTQIATLAEIRELAEEGNVHAQRASELMRRAGGWFALLMTPPLFGSRPAGPPLEDWEQREIVECVERAVAPAREVEADRETGPPTKMLFEIARPP